MPQPAYLGIKALNLQLLVKNPCLAGQTACAPFLKQGQENRTNS